MPRPEVFKVQISLATTAPVRQALVYNRDRSVEGQFPATPELLKLMEGLPEPKGYFMCEVRDGLLHIGDEVEAPGW